MNKILAIALILLLTGCSIGGEKKIKSLQSFAELSTDELIGCYDEIGEKRFKVDGYLEEFALSKKEAEDLIMSARDTVFK